MQTTRNYINFKYSSFQFNVKQGTEDWMSQKLEKSLSLKMPERFSMPYLLLNPINIPCYIKTSKFWNLRDWKNQFKNFFVVVKYTSNSLIVPVHVHPSFGQTAAKASTSLRAALSGKAYTRKWRLVPKLYNTHHIF